MTLTRRTALFGAYCLGLVLSHVQVLRALYDYSRENVSTSHVVLIPLVTSVLVFQERASIFSSVRTSRAGLAVVLLGAALSPVARLSWAGAGHGDALTWVVGSLVVLVVGGFVLIYGEAAAKAATFPLVFLLFMVPIPGGLLNGATWLLKKGSTETVAGLFWLTGTPYHREGFVFSLPNLVIEVADECSGIRSSIALLLTTLLAGHMLLHRRRNQILLVLSVFPLAVLKNAIRIVSLSLLAIHVDPGFIVGRLHHEGGFVFFLISLAVLSPVFSFLRNSEMRPRAGDSPA